jgi:glycopeptide antibiotics resistance protein/DNA-binding XRE family transcriptional regulator
MDCRSTGRFIARLRQSAGMTQRDLAERLGVTGGAVSKWERGLCYPDIELVAHMAELFSVQAGEILAGGATGASGWETKEDTAMTMTRKRRRQVLALGLWCYGAVLIYALLLRNGLRLTIPGLWPDYAETLVSGISLRPLRTLTEYWALGRDDWRIPADFISGHIALFLPLGWLLPSRWPRLRCLSRTLGAALGVILVLELTQLFTTLGVFDVDAILLNLTGTSLGFLCWRCTPDIFRLNA